MAATTDIEVPEWLPWVALEGSWRGDSIPRSPGLYRIRRVGRTDLDYIGQTGMGTMNLRKRLAMLKGVFGDVMPYRDPHTAGPALWALRQATGEEFEVSAAAIDGTTSWRKGMEAVAIATYRQEHGGSPTVSFGRMRDGYRMSSANNAKVVAAGRRFPGGPTGEQDDSHLPGIAPMGPLDGDVTGAAWCNHAWTDWVGLEDVGRAVPAAALGLYRLSGDRDDSLLYVGEGKMRDRLRAHRGKMDDPEHPQGNLMRKAGRIRCSWVIDRAWFRHQRLELETDLIAAHLLGTGEVPPAQFLG